MMTHIDRDQLHRRHDKTTAYDELHLEMVEAFGLPTPTSAEHVEVFGWYHCGEGLEEGPKYWLHDPTTHCWSVNKGGVRRAKLAPMEWLAAELDEAQQRYEQLSMMSSPPLPKDGTSSSSSPPFLYEGWMFTWFFFPELRRWELAPLGRA